MCHERYRKKGNIQIPLATMSIYAVVQFLNKTRKECAVVPLIWITDNNSICYWPNTKSDVKFKALVKSNAVYQSSWKKFNVNAVLHTEGIYETRILKTYVNLLYIKSVNIYILNSFI